MDSKPLHLQRLAKGNGLRDSRLEELQLARQKASNRQNKKPSSGTWKFGCSRTNGRCLFPRKAMQVDNSPGLHLTLGQRGSWSGRSVGCSWRLDSVVGPWLLPPYFIFLKLKAYPLSTIEISGPRQDQKICPTINLEKSRPPLSTSLVSSIIDEGQGDEFLLVLLSSLYSQTAKSATMATATMTVSAVPTPKKKGADLAPESERFLRCCADVANALIEDHESTKDGKSTRDINLNSLRAKLSKKHKLTNIPPLTAIIAAIPEHYKKYILPKLIAKPISMTHRYLHQNKTGMLISSRNFIWNCCRRRHVQAS